MNVQREHPIAAQREHSVPRAQREHPVPAQREHSVPRVQRGMTLLELLVALAIFAFLGSALFPVMTGALGSRTDATARIGLDAEARAILDRLEQDIAGNFEAGFRGPLPVRFLAPAPPGRTTAAERILLETTTLVARGVTAADAIAGGEDMGKVAADRGDQAHVRWRIDESGRLLRQELRPPREEPVDWTEVPFEVLSARAAVVLEFYEPEIWLSSWDSGETGAHRGRAPVAVRTTVTVGEDADRGLELVSTVVLPVVETAVDVRRARGNEP